MHDSYKTKKTLKIGKKNYVFNSLKLAEKNGLKNISSLPFSIKILLENLIRNEDGVTVTSKDIQTFSKWKKNKKIDLEINFRPARVLMQDFTGVPAVVDLAAMRAAMKALRSDPKKINPLTPVDLVIDHSVMVDKAGNAGAYKANVELEYKRNIERYEFLRWGQKSLDNFRVVPPGIGICHQVNLENLARTVWSDKKEVDGKVVNLAYPDTVVGTDSHTTMINGLSVLGWGVGGIEAEAAMLGQPISMVVPEVVGFEVVGKLKEGTTATDLVLTITEILRKKGVVSKFVEFFGSGLKDLPVADRATIANMAPEYGATCGIFPIDDETIKFLEATGRPKDEIALTKKYAKEQGMWESHTKKNTTIYTSKIKLDLSSIVPCLSGPKRPQDKIELPNVAKSFDNSLKVDFQTASKSKISKVKNKKFSIDHGHVAIAAITSCTNTSNPSVMIGAGLLAQKAYKLGLRKKPWVKTSLAPGSKVVMDYLVKSGTQKYLDYLGFQLVGFGCTTCIGNSGPLDEDISNTISENELIVSGVLSGNRNFEGRINPHVKANYLASPPLVVAYALAGSTKIDITKDPIGENKNGKKIYLKDIWPTSKEIKKMMNKTINSKLYINRYKNVFAGDAKWKKVKASSGLTYEWNKKSTYVQHPPYFENMKLEGGNIKNVLNANVLGIFGDSVTTDHISPAGSIKTDGPAGDYLRSKSVNVHDFNSFGARRGNHEIMMRGTFSNIRIKNEMLDGIEGGYTCHYPSKKQMSIFDASMKYQKANTSLVIFSGKDYGMGSSRDWAAKGTNLLGVKAVIAESYERIHRSNLVGMGVLPLQFIKGESRKSLKLKGSEIVTITGLDGEITPNMQLPMAIKYASGKTVNTKVNCLIKTVNEVEYLQTGGILQYVLKNLAESA
ncbi:aconitate hydratase AcnA [Pelagibacterales bacterium]|jgi:aconitate hydratase|nr:aconitate hydratase AcnA [Pelagibacterales bacterium]MDC3263516.1 aconitate hydratase AcnA [Pelagibacterales bacterium]